MLRQCQPASSLRSNYRTTQWLSWQLLCGTVTKTMSVAPPLGNELKRKKTNSQTQHHLSALDLFWANLWVQHHLPPLDLAWTRKTWASNFFVRVQLTPLLLISPGLCLVTRVLWRSIYCRGNADVVSSGAVCTSCRLSPPVLQLHHSVRFQWLRNV